MSANYFANSNKDIGLSPLYFMEVASLLLPTIQDKALTIKRARILGSASIAGPAQILRRDHLLYALIQVSKIYKTSPYAGGGASVK